MFKIVGKDTIYHTRGDSLYLFVRMTNKDDGTDYVPQEGDEIRFALKREYNDNEIPLILKDIPYNTQILHLEPSDTKNLPYGKYVYDVQLTKPNGDVITFIPDDPEKSAQFHCCKEVY